MSSFREFETELLNDPLAIRALQERVASAMEEMEYTERDLFSIRLALEEALVNAVKHGNRCDPEKRVRVGCQVNSVKIRIEVEDDGDGFTPQEVPCPTDGNNMLRPSGRGIQLMRHFMCAVEYNDAGNRLVMEKHRNPAPSDVCSF